MKEKAHYLLLIIFTFLFIYYPPIFPTNTLHILGVISWIIILCNMSSFSKLFIRGGYIKEILFSLFMTSYLCIVLLMNGGTDLLIGYVFITLGIEILPISFVIVYFLKKLNGKRKFTDLIIHVGFLQSVFSVLTFLIPQLQLWVINTMLSYGYRDIIIRLSQHRMFGLSYTFPYSMPIVQGVIACLSMYLGINKNAKYFIFTPFLIFSGIINARICIVIALIGALLILFDSLRLKFRKKYKIVIIVLFFTLLFNPISNFIQEVSPSTYAWLYDGGEELINLFYGDTSGSYMSYITNKANYILPSDLNFVFGTSKRVIRDNTTYKSDIGYVNDIWLGGIVYAVIIYSYLIIKLKKIWQSLNNQNANGTITSLFLLLVIASGNLKGTIYAVNEFINLFYLIYIACILGIVRQKAQQK